MGLNIQTATEILKDFLVSNLTDPLSNRTTSWIYSDDTRIDLDKSPYPKILIKLKNQQSTKERLGLGELSTINTDIIQIQIKTGAGNNYTYDETDYTSIEFSAFLGAETDELIKNNHAHFITNGLLHVIPVRDELTEDKDRNPIYTLDIEIQYISSN